MKNNQNLKRLLFNFFFMMAFLSSSTLLAMKSNPYAQNEVKVSAEINKDTTDEELEDIKGLLKSNGIDCKFNRIYRNENNEIVRIQIQLENENGNKAKSTFSSSSPIGPIVLGANNHSLYVRSKGIEKSGFNSQISRLSKMFEEDGQLTINGDTMDMNDLIDRMQQSMKDMDFNFDEIIGNLNNNSKISIPNSMDRMRLKQHLGEGRIVIINGKEKSEQDVLNILSSENSFDVDYLKPKISKSIYGEKGAKGAIIISMD